MIALDQANTVAGVGSSFTFPHQCVGANRILFAVVCYVPDQDQEIQAVTYGGQPMTKYGDTQIRSDVYEEFWFLVAPPEGVADVGVELSAPAKTVCASASFTGVAQADPIYFRANGVGDMVSQIPLACEARSGDMLFGFGAVSGDGQAPVEVWQIGVWDKLQESNIRSQGIASFPNFTAQITVANKIVPASRWAADIVGVRAA